MIEHTLYNDKEKLGELVRITQDDGRLKGLRFALDDAFAGDSMKILGEIGTLDRLAFLKTDTPKAVFRDLLSKVRDRTVIERISTVEDVKTAQSQGFRYGQGFLFGRKAPYFVSPRTPYNRSSSTKHAKMR